MNQPTESTIFVELRTIDNSVSELKNMFDQAKQIYKQDKGNFYKSKININDFTLAVLPERDTYLFTSYSIGDSNDIERLRELYKGENIFKTYDCTLCAIDNRYNAVNLSDEQNQLIVPKPNSKDPAVEIHQAFEGTKGRKYLITGTVPQYYYNHLLLSSQDHLPTYAIFFDTLLFNDLMEYLKEGSREIRNLYAFFNGNFGSDIFHFHTHLTNEDNLILQRVADDYKSNGTFYFNSTIIKMLVFTYNDLDKLRDNVFQYTSRIMYLLQDPKQEHVVITANFFFKNDRYFVTIQTTDRRSNTWKYKNCDFVVFPASFTLVASSCFKSPDNTSEEVFFKQNMIDNFKNLYISPENYNELETVGYNDFVENILNLDLITLLRESNVQKFYIWMESKREKNQIDENILEYLMTEITTIVNCYSLECNPIIRGMFNYIVGVVFNNISVEQLNSPKVREFQILAEFYRMKSMNRYNNVTSDYMYFRGKFIQHFLVKTIKNLLIITQGQPINNIMTQTPDIEKWMKHTFKRIGESSASGVNTITELKFPDVDMVMKTMNTTDIQYYEEKTKEFRHEFFAGMEINKIRDYIPNFILTYGGFLCNSSSEDKLCDQGPGSDFSYLLIENIKNASTLGRRIKTPILSYEKEIEDMYDIIAQIITSLAFGWNAKQFTHYDLHTDNVMIYDFIQNSHFMKLFKNYNENIPEIKTTLFRYFMSDKDQREQIIIPAKYLLLIIDYGNSFVDGMPTGTHFQYPNRYDNLGMTSDKPNKVFDVYTILMSVFLHIFVYKSYLFFENRDWRVNLLTKLFYSMLDGYKELWTVQPDIIMQSILELYNTRANRVYWYQQMFLSFIKPKYKVSSLQYLHKDFQQESVTGMFTNGAMGVINMMQQERYNGMITQKLLERNDTYVFNWGYVPNDLIVGIQPNQEIKDMIQNKFENKKQMVDTMRRYTKDV